MDLGQMLKMAAQLQPLWPDIQKAMATVKKMEGDGDVQHLVATVEKVAKVLGISLPQT